MKAVVHDEYGEVTVLRLVDIDKPVPGDDEVLIAVHTASIHPGDWLLMTGRPYLFRPGFGMKGPRKRIPGFDMAGTVEAVGANVTEFQPGDEVFGEAPDGSCAEFVLSAEDRVAPKPTNLTLDQAAVVAVSGTAALRCLREGGKLQSGQHVLINGASGGIGTFAVQIAKALGAEVTGVCSTDNVDLVGSIGADHVIDYTKDNFTEGGPRYDFILDNVGNHSLADCRRALTPDGVLLTNNGTGGNPWVGPLGRMVAAAVQSLFNSKQALPLYAAIRKQDLIDLKNFMEAGQVRPVVGETYPLAQTAEAMAYIGQGHAKGKVAITI